MHVYASLKWSKEALTTKLTHGPGCDETSKRHQGTLFKTFFKTTIAS